MSTESWLEDLQADAERKIRDGEDPRTASRDLVHKICERIEEAEDKSLDVKIEELQGELNCAKEDLEQTNAENTRLEGELETVKKRLAEVLEGGPQAAIAEADRELEAHRAAIENLRDKNKRLEDINQDKIKALYEKGALVDKLKNKVEDYDKLEARYLALQKSVEESRNLPPRRLYLGKLADLKKLPAGTRVERVGSGVTLELDDPKTYACHRTDDGREGKLDEAIKGHLFVPTAAGFACYDKLNQILSVYKITQPGVES